MRPTIYRGDNKMTKKMLIDATHKEETRVAVVDGQHLVEFDYESIVRKQLKGSVYLAKVTRVEPSLQAAFVNYGGNRHGFLPFSEIHPDYFRIPVSDREALIAAQEEELAKLDAVHGTDDDIDLDIEDDIIDAEIIEVTDESDDDDDEEVVEVGGADKPADEEDSDLKKAEAKKKAKKAPQKAPKKTAAKKKPAAKKSAKAKKEGSLKQDEDAQPASFNNEEQLSDEELDAIALEKANALKDTSGDIEDDKQNNGRNNRRNYKGRKPNPKNKRANMRKPKSDEIMDDGESGKPFRFNLRHKYKIQEVVKRGQIVLIQVSKEERGNKGAAVTSYLSLPGRYCVLMPNSPRGGGVSRKIGNFKDRKRMREILKELDVPKGMSVILRTAGVSRTKAEIKRDLDYLIRLWNTIREDTLNSTAPACIYEEGNLIKRSIRDLYTRDIDEVLVSGEKGHKTAKSFMKMLVPSHAKKVQEYKDERVPLFHRYHVEKQISEIGQISVTLKSGGYLVINPTEALVSIDVNSGKATKERHIEETALKTNLESADEVARQLRLRDLGGLVVIDFIDMEDRRNNRKVENRLRDALSSDRARIQVGRISSFGLLELSRQRLNPSLMEAQFQKCDHCEGVGTVKTLDFAAITAMRAIEEEGIKNNVAELSLNVPNNVAVYILNNKRSMLADIEKRYDFRVHIRTDDNLMPSEFRLDIIKGRDGEPLVEKPKQAKKPNQNQNQSQNKNHHNHNDEEGEGQHPKKKSRRRGRRGGRKNNRNNNPQDAENNAQDNQKNNQGSNDKPQNNVSKADTPNDNQKQGKSPKETNVEDSKPNNSKPAFEDKKGKKETALSDNEDKRTEKPKAAAKKPKKGAKSKEQKPSNDVKGSSKNLDSPKPYETVNKEPAKKKKGWWNRLVD